MRTTWTLCTTADACVIELSPTRRFRGSPDRFGHDVRSISGNARKYVRPSAYIRLLREELLPPPRQMNFAKIEETLHDEPTLQDEATEEENEYTDAYTAHAVEPVEEPPHIHIYHAAAYVIEHVHAASYGIRPTCVWHDANHWITGCAYSRVIVCGPHEI